MRIQDVMSKNVVRVAPDTPVAVARARLQEAEIHHLVIVEKDRVVGVMSGKDAADASPDAPVSTVMSRHVVTIEPSATLRRAAGILRGRAIGCLPVVDKGRLVGILTTSDLLTALAKGEIHAGAPDGRVVLRKRGPRKRPAMA